MKLLHVACLSGMLWLTGCATNSTTNGSAPSASADSSNPLSFNYALPETHTADIPQGALRPKVGRAR